ncbi:family 16 glycoside hydrolase, partial [Draconibacterium sp.]|uniref:family 16 glycoside hydrolase n=1 Tax=Draconibacterium sp. TaxID=1965318 RepID=UPI00356155AF
GTNVILNGELWEQHCTDSKSKTQYDDEWVSVEVEVHGGEVIRHFVGGEEVLSYEKPQLDPRDQYFEKLLPADGNEIISGGTISIQAESHGTDFRKIELLILNE